MEGKKCIKCNKNKLISNFYVIKGKPDYYCKDCRLAGTLKSHRKHKKDKPCTVDECKNPQYSKRLCKVHYERVARNGDTDLRIKQKSVYRNGSTYEQQRRQHLKQVYQLTQEEYDVMAANGCEMCGESNEHRSTMLHVDHYHGHCGKRKACKICTRGILCDKCNRAVGLYENDNLREDYPMFDKVIVYVTKYSQLISDRIIEDESRRVQETE
jgi:hypothetical protein